MKKLDNTLIIGIGNNTRQDDGLGWCFLENLETAGFNKDHLLYKYQLMVEDAELIAQYKTVVFVDANKTALDNGFSIERVFPSKKVAFSTHAVPPNQILNLCATIYQKKPISYLLKIEGYQWDFNLELTKKALANLKKALLAFKAFPF